MDTFKPTFLIQIEGQTLSADITQKITSLTSDRRSPLNFNVSKAVAGVGPIQMITTPNGGAGSTYQTHLLTSGGSGLQCFRFRSPPWWPSC